MNEQEKDTDPGMAGDYGIPEALAGTQEASGFQAEAKARQSDTGRRSRPMNDSQYYSGAVVYDGPPTRQDIAEWDREWLRTPLGTWTEPHDRERFIATQAYMRGMKVSALMDRNRLRHAFVMGARQHGAGVDWAEEHAFKTFPEPEPDPVEYLIGDQRFRVFRNGRVDRSREYDGGSGPGYEWDRLTAKERDTILRIAAALQGLNVTRGNR